MLNEVRDFFKREKLYGLLLIVAVAVYITFLVTKTKEPPKEESEIVESFKEAEKKLQTKIKDAGSVEEYFKDRPDVQLWIQAFTFIIFLALTAGLIIDFKLLLDPIWRSRVLAARPPPSPGNWKFSMLFKFFLWFFVGNVALGFALFWIRPALAGQENMYLLLHTTLAEIFSLILIILLVRKQGDSVKSLGLWVPEGKWWREMVAGWTTYLAIIPIFAIVITLVVWIAKLLNYEPPPHPLVPIFLEEEQRTPVLIYYSLILASIFGPFFEEVFFRGFAYPILKGRWGTTFAMLATAAFFAFIHESSFAFWPIFVLGLGLVFVYEKRGSLIAPITMHITHNILFLAYFFFSKGILSRELGG